MQEKLRRAKEVTFDLMIIVGMLSVALCALGLSGGLIIQIMKMGKDFCK